MSESARETQLVVNGRSEVVSLDAETTLLELLRDRLHLTGTKYNCEQGECGACTVLVDGEPVNSCITLGFTVDGSAVTTIEGLEKDGVLDPLQQALHTRNDHGFQRSASLRFPP